MADVNKTLKDALYVGVGLGVLAFQQAQVRRRELSRQMEAQLGDTGEQLQKLAQRLESRLEPVLTDIQERVGPRAGEVLEQARRTVRDAQEQFLGRSDGASARA